jgi:hypothetical protein
MDEDDIVPLRKGAGIDLGCRLIERFLFGGQNELSALESVVDLFCDVEKGTVAANDPPVRDHTQVIEQRHGGTQELGHAATVGRRIQVKNPRSAELCRGLAQIR